MNVLSACACHCQQFEFANCYCGVIGFAAGLAIVAVIYVLLRSFQ